MVEIAILSDLHLDLRRRHLMRAGLDERTCDAAMRDMQAAAREAARAADIVVLAGDISAGTAGLDWDAASFPGKPVVYVAGNHEFYRWQHGTLIRALHERAAAGRDLHFLERDAVVLPIAGRRLRVLGCTLWTDYRLYGRAVRADAMRRAEREMYDHRRIQFGAELLRPKDAWRLHIAARRWLRRQLADPAEPETLVVTHHAPVPHSVEPRFRGDSLSPAFASDLTGLIEQHGPSLWVHGHTHHNVDYRLANTRVVAHQWGYPAEDLSRRPKLVHL